MSNTISDILGYQAYRAIVDKTLKEIIPDLGFMIEEIFKDRGHIVQVRYWDTIHHNFFCIQDKETGEDFWLSIDDYVSLSEDLIKTIDLPKADLWTIIRCHEKVIVGSANEP